jgi:cbb3-type cytochrome oxidase subunit 3
MNKSQKFALFLIAFILLSITLIAIVLIPIFFFGRCMPLLFFGRCIGYIAPAILLAVYIGGLFWATRKQSKDEVETDEMDVAIQKMAAIISFASILIVVGVLLIIANLVWGLNAAVPLWVLMLSFGALVPIVLVVWSIAILVQYGRKEKNHE